MDFTWLDGLDASVTVCDREGVIVYMNAAAERTFAKDGGRALVGKSLWACHPPQANDKMRRMMEEGSSHSYSIEKNGAKKFIHQTPWMDQGVCRGLVEIAFPIPDAVPHFVRDKKGS